MLSNRFMVAVVAVDIDTYLCEHEFLFPFPRDVFFSFFARFVFSSSHLTPFQMNTVSILVGVRTYLFRSFVCSQID